MSSLNSCLLRTCSSLAEVHRWPPSSVVEFRWSRYTALANLFRGELAPYPLNFEEPV